MTNEGRPGGQFPGVTVRSRPDLRAQEYLPGHNRRRFRRSTRQWAERLARAGLGCRREEWIGGHDQEWWKQQLPVALGWLLRAEESKGGSGG